MVNIDGLFTVKVWRDEGSQVETRTAVPWGLASAIAASCGWYKTQVVSQWGIVELETKNPPDSFWDDAATLAGMTGGCQASNDARGASLEEPVTDCQWCLKPKVMSHHGCAC